MGKKSQPAAPTPPNPYEIIGAEAQANRINQNTPYGSLTYSGPNNSTANLTLDPRVQQLLDSQMGMDQTVLNQGQQQLQNLPQNTPFQGFGIPGQTGQSQNIPGLQTFTGQMPNAPSLQTPYAQPNLAPNLQRDVGGVNLNGNTTQPNLQQSIGGLNLGGAAPLPQNYEAYRNDAEKAFFNRSSGLLNEQFGRDEEKLRQTLANQGLQSGGNAFGQEFGQFNQRRGETYENLARDATLFGGQEASRQLGDQLALHSAGTNDALQQFNAGLTQGQFGNQAQQQGFQNQLSGLGFGNDAQLQQLNANLGIAGFGNQAATQQFGLNSQVRDQNLQNQQFGNDTALQNFGLQNQGFQNELQRLGANNAGRTQLFNETAAARGTQFNELASLLGLQQVQQPQLQNFFAPGQVNTTDAFGLQQAGKQNNFNTQSQAASAAKASTADLIGNILGAIPFSSAGGSDRRLKKVIGVMGKYKDHNVYIWAWNKIAEKVFGYRGFGMGVMADEVPAEFVSMRDGYQIVNYGAL